MSGKADFRTAFMGMEGSPFVIATLSGLQNKLWQKLVLQVGAHAKQARLS